MKRAVRNDAGTDPDTSGNTFDVIVESQANLDAFIGPGNLSCRPRERARSYPAPSALSRLAGPLLAALFLVAGCSNDDATAPTDFGSDPVPDFSIRDVNATSPRFDAMVSPRDYEGGVSAWYFGHAT